MAGKLHEIELSLAAAVGQHEATGGLFNFIGSISVITTPIAIGYIVKGTGSFNGSLVFVGANALLTVFSYLVFVREIKRLKLVTANA